jgi:hypothetical protein
MDLTEATGYRIKSEVRRNASNKQWPLETILWSANYFYTVPLAVVC